MGADEREQKGIKVDVGHVNGIKNTDKETLNTGINVGQTFSKKTVV